MNKVTVTNQDLEAARQNPDNKHLMQSVCACYANILPPDTLTSCKDIALWRCLQSHKSNMGQVFTSSLFRFVHWECLREIGYLKGKVKTQSIQEEDSYEDDSSKKIIIEEYLNGLPPLEKKVVVMRYIEDRTLSDIGQQIGYSKQGVQNILTRAISSMQKVAIKNSK